MAKIKIYKVFLMTEKGPINLIYCDTESIAEFEDGVMIKYGSFTMLQCQEIK